jgi:hypothetical protein
MNFQLNIAQWVAIVMSSIAFNPIQPSNATPNIGDTEFFKGNWDCKLQNFPYTSFRWLVIEKNSRLNGNVFLGQNKVSSDFWQIVNGNIERFAATRDGVLVNVKSSGWESNRLVLAGSFSKPTESFSARQTITKKTDREFQAIWERIGSDRRRMTFSDEICTKSG